MDALWHGGALGFWCKIIVAGGMATLGYGTCFGAALQLAREALTLGDEKAAAGYYRAIKADDTAWPEKIEDGMRYHLLTNNSQEAWRLFQVASRVGASIDDLTYYGILAALRAGSCPLAMPASDHIRDHLVYAYVIRNQERFRGDYSSSAYEERRIHLAGGLVHFLADIPQARLISGLGCRVARLFLPEERESAREELEPLQKFVRASLNGDAPNDPPGINAVYARYMELALQVLREAKKPTQARQALTMQPEVPLVIEDPLLLQVVDRYKTLDGSGWALIAEPERRFVWQLLEDIGWFAKVPWTVESRETGLALQIVMASKERDAAYWLGKIPYDELPVEQREALLDHLLSIPNFPFRSQILVRKARILLVRGDWNDALGMLRELLLEGASSRDQNAQRAALNMAAQLFSEHRYNDQLLGAIHASIPAELWNEMLYAVLLDQALAGYRKGFDHLEKTLAHPKRPKPPSSIVRALKILRPLAHRQINPFEREMNRDGKGDGSAHWTLSFLADLGQRLSSFPVVELQKIEPYMQVVRNHLREQLATGRNQKRLLDLLALYDYGAEENHDKGRAAAIRGTSHLGVIDLSEDVVLAQPYTWYAPDSLPRRDLLYMPSQVGDRAWVIR